MKFRWIYVWFLLILCGCTDEGEPLPAALQGTWMSETACSWFQQLYLEADSAQIAIFQQEALSLSFHDPMIELHFANQSEAAFSFEILHADSQQLILSPQSTELCDTFMQFFRPEHFYQADLTLESLGYSYSGMLNVHILPNRDIWVFRDRFYPELQQLQEGVYLRSRLSDSSFLSLQEHLRFSRVQAWESSPLRIEGVELSDMDFYAWQMRLNGEEYKVWRRIGLPPLQAKLEEELMRLIQQQEWEVIDTSFLFPAAVDAFRHDTKMMIEYASIYEPENYRLPSPPIPSEEFTERIKAVFPTNIQDSLRQRKAAFRLRVTVDANGEVRRVWMRDEAFVGYYPQLEEVVRGAGKWTPARMGGQRIMAQAIVPVRF